MSHVVKLASYRAKKKIDYLNTSAKLVLKEGLLLHP